MAVRRLIVSDLHFGSGDDLLRSPEALERIEPELAWCDELVINGDCFELVFSSLTEAVDASRSFFDLAARRVESIVILPGNHDHHLVSLATDMRRLAEATGADPGEPFRVEPAERLLRHLAPGVRVLAPYPICELDGLRITHGHYIAPHLESFGWQMMDRLSWGLTGSPRRTRGLEVADYEALIAPLYDLMYSMANLPAGRQAQVNFERWLVAAASLVRAPTKASRQVVSFVHSLLRHDRREELLQQIDAPTSSVLAAMEAVCENLQIPAGEVTFGHTHTPLAAAAGPSGRWTFHNSGSWMYDRRMRGQAHYRDLAWPGTVLRATGGDVEVRRLLDDLTETDLHAMVGSVSDPKRRRRLRAAARRREPVLRTPVCRVTAPDSA